MFDIKIVYFYFRLTNTYKSLLNKIEVADSKKDLKWWSVQHGPGMQKKWPDFEVSNYSNLVEMYSKDKYLPVQFFFVNTEMTFF